MGGLKYYTLISKDQRNMNYVFFKDDEDDVLRVRPSSKHLIYHSPYNLRQDRPRDSRL